MGIPLVRNNSVDDINTSIIAIKKELGKGGSGDMGDVNVNVDVKYEVTDTVEDGNSLPVTSQGVYDYVEGQGFTPVDEVAINNMKAVTSNAVAESLSYSTTEQKTGGVWIDGKDIYKKTWTGAISNGTTLVSDVDTLVSQYGSLMVSSNSWGPFPRDSGSSYAVVRLNESNHSLFTDFSTTWTCKFTVLYTKNE